MLVIDLIYIAATVALIIGLFRPSVFSRFLNGRQLAEKDLDVVPRPLVKKSTAVDRAEREQVGQQLRAWLRS